MNGRRSLVVVGSLTLAIAVAHAEPASPSSTSTPASTGGRVPARLVDRPHILPARTLELDGWMGAAWQPGYGFVLAGVSSRYSLGFLEAFLGLEAVVIDPEPQDPILSTLHDLHAGARLRLGPGSGQVRIDRFDTIGRRVTYGAAQSELELRGTYAYKGRVRDNLAVTGEGGLVFDVDTMTEFDRPGETVQALSVVGRVEGQVSTANRLGFVASLQLAQRVTGGGSSVVRSGMLVGEGLYTHVAFDTFARLETRVVDHGGRAYTVVLAAGLRLRPL